MQKKGDRRGYMKSIIIFYGVVTCVLTLMVLTITQSPFIPYNVRELVVAEYPIISSFLFICFIYWSFGVPVWLAIWFQKVGSQALLFPAVALIHGGVAWIILRFAVPMESIGDIVGAPILSWPWELEYIARFIPLYFIITFCVTFAALACLVLYFGGKRTILIKYLSIGLFFIAISHWVVVEKAATDNLTELMASGGTLLSSLLAVVFLFIIIFTGSQLAVLTTQLSRHLRMIVFTSCVLLYPVAFLSISGATEKAVAKYGKVFSALQFLLSPDRDNYVAFPELLIRYAVAHTGAVLLIALLQVPIWRWVSKNKLGKIT